jgi:phosphoribosylanthranilate isomerase
MRVEDAAAAARAGVDAIGLNFYPKARRCVSLERGREILAVVPAFVTSVGLFVDQDVDEIRSVAEALRLGHLQLHGRETPHVVAALRGFRVLKALRADRQTLPGELEMWREAIGSLSLVNLQGILLETPGSAGGSGVENDWETIASLQRSGAFEGLPPVILAGGLTPGNVAGVVRRLEPYAVDVSSGVEEGFGEKSVGRIEAFVAEVMRGERP